MSFWSGESLSSRLVHLIEPFSVDQIDCAAYTLRIGPEIFVTSDRNKVDPRSGCKIVLREDQPFKIPAGQFAFLLSEERVKVPDNAVAFISFKTNQKWLGLVNVSGFHVDPGWDGNLMFGVYNAGPTTIHLRRGMPMFLIWYADLDHSTAFTYKRDPEKGSRRIPEKYINAMSGKVFSPQVLAGELQRLKIQVAVVQTLGISILGAVIILGVREWIESRPTSAPAVPATAVTAPAPPTSSAAPLPHEQSTGNGQPPEVKKQSTSDHGAGGQRAATSGPAQTPDKTQPDNATPETPRAK